MLERGTCLRRNYGAIIVQNDEIVATGYTGAPRGRKNCDETGFCMREHLKIPSGQRYELCRSVNAEANAIISAPRSAMIGATLYLADEPTGNLDPPAGEQVMELLRGLDAGGHTIVLITHDRGVARQAARRVRMEDGRLLE